MYAFTRRFYPKTTCIRYTYFVGWLLNIHRFRLNVLLYLTLNRGFGPSSSGSRGWDVGVACLEPDVAIRSFETEARGLLVGRRLGLFLLFNFFFLDYLLSLRLPSFWTTACLLFFLVSQLFLWPKLLSF